MLPATNQLIAKYFSIVSGLTVTTAFKYALYIFPWNHLIHHFVDACLKSRYYNVLMMVIIDVTFTWSLIKGYYDWDPSSESCLSNLLLSVLREYDQYKREQISSAPRISDQWKELCEKTNYAKDCEVYYSNNGRLVSPFHFAKECIMWYLLKDYFSNTFYQTMHQESSVMLENVVFF